MNDRALDDKSRLARELLSSLSGDKSGGRTEDPLTGGSRAKPLDGEVAVAGKQKRDNKRFTTPVLRVVVDKSTYPTVDWSLGGMMLKGYVGDLRQNMRCGVTFAHPDATQTYFNAHVRIQRVDQIRRTLSFKFEKLSEGGFDFLSRLQFAQLKARAAQRP